MLAASEARAEVKAKAGGGSGAREKTGGRVETRGFCVVLVSLASLGGCFSKDIVTAVSPQIRKSFGLSHAQYATVASLQGLPNCVLAFVTGSIVDKIGFRPSLVGFAAMVSTGTLFVAFSSLTGKVWMLVAGQLVIGIGKQVVSVAQKVAFPHVAAAKHIGISLGFQLATNRIGFGLGWAVSPFLIDEEKGDCSLALAASFGICMFSFVCVVILFCLTAQKKEGRHQYESVELEELKSSGRSESEVKPRSEMKELVDTESGEISSRMVKRDIQRIEVKPRLPRSDKKQNPSSVSAEKSSCSFMLDLYNGITQLSPQFWWLAGTMVMYYSCFLPFKVIALEFLMDDRGITETAADRLISMVSIIPIAGCIGTGIFIDGTGKISETLEVGMFLNLCTLMLLQTQGHYKLGMIVLGVADSLVCTAGWILVPQAVKPHRRGLAIGLVHALEHSWDVPLNSIFGWMRDTTGSNALTFQYMTVLALLGLLSSFMFRRKWKSLQHHRS